VNFGTPAKGIEPIDKFPEVEFNKAVIEGFDVTVPYVLSYKYRPLVEDSEPIQ
jgi:hypothetical protein